MELSRYVVWYTREGGLYGDLLEPHAAGIIYVLHR